MNQAVFNIVNDDKGQRGKRFKPMMKLFIKIEFHTKFLALLLETELK